MAQVKDRHFNMPNDEEIDEFLTKVDEVTSKVRNILDGKISVEEIEKEERKLILEKRAKEIKEEEKKEKEKRDFIMGKEGKGNGYNYLHFCSNCFVEYNYDLKNCQRCNKIVITRKQRISELEEKVKKYKSEKDKRNIRRSNWKQFLKSQKNNENKKKMMNYEKWNYYEPSSDTFDEDEKNLYALPRDNENFQILEKQLNEDIKKRNENKKIAYNIKQKGNDFFKQKNYLYAIDCYKDALNICKDYLEVYNNLALCQIKVYQYENAIESCDKVIEYHNIFQADLKIKKSTIFKSYARKGLALFKLRKFHESLENFNLALSVYPDDKETVEYAKKCKQIIADYDTVQHNKYFSSKNKKSQEVTKKNIEKGKRENLEEDLEKKVIYNNDKSNFKDHNFDEENYEYFITEFSGMDIKKRAKMSLKYIKNMKRVLKKNKEVKLKFCSYTYDIKDKKSEKIKKVTLLSFFVEQLNDILFYVKKEYKGNIFNLENINYENLYIPKHLKKSGNLITDILTLILEENDHYSDFCVDALKPILTFYFFKILKVSKCIHFLLYIGENNEARKVFCDIVENNNSILKYMLNVINNYIEEQRSHYTKEETSRFEFLKGCISKDAKDNGNEIKKDDNNRNCVCKNDNKNISGDNAINSKLNNKISYDEGSKKFEKKLEEKKENIFEKKFEFINLFGILAHFSVESNVLNLLIKNFMEDILNIIIFINEKFYDYDQMHCNYLSFLVNLVGNIKIRSIFLNSCWSNIFYFVEKIGNENLMKNVLSVIFNLTITWSDEIETKNFLSFHKEIKRDSFHKIIKYTHSIDKRVNELCFLLLSRFYLYNYYLLNKEMQKQKNNSDTNNSDNNNINNNNVNNNNIISNDENGINSFNNNKICHSLKKSVFKESEILIHLDEFSISSLKKSISFTLSEKNELPLINSCINLVLCLSRCTNFFNALIEKKNNSFFYELINTMCSIFLSIQNNITKDKSLRALINNIIIFCSYVLKFLSFNTHYNNMDILTKIEKLIPVVIQEISSPDKILKKNISIFLSRCFLNNYLKPTILSLYNNDINQIYFLLKAL